MNELDYASLEASKKLVDNGIKLDTDCFYKIGDGGGLFDYDHYDAEYMDYPAPSMAEVWRELPEGIETKRGKICLLTLEKAGTAKGGCGDTFASYKGQPESWVVNANPTDALIDLLIFVRKEKP